MSKQAKAKPKPTAPAAKRWFDLSYRVSALIVGLALLALGAALWIFTSRHALDDRLLKKLPRDAYVAGVSRLSVTHVDTLHSVADSTQVAMAPVKALSDGLSAAGLDTKTLRRALGDQYAFAATSKGAVAVFTVKDPSQLATLQDRLQSRLEGVKNSQTDGMDVTAAMVKGSTAPFFTARSGHELYVASDAALLAQAKSENNGFTAVERFRELASSLPPGADGYVFFHTDPVKDKVGQDLPLFALAYSDDGAYLQLRLRTTANSPVSNVPGGTRGRLLPPPDQASASVEGLNVLDYLHLIEEQRQEDNIPKVLSLQTGLANLSRTLGAEVEKQYIAPANGHFVYTRFQDTQGPQYAAAVEFPDAATAQAKVAELKDALANKVTVPVRKQVVTILPDGSQSREVVGEGRQPLAFADEPVGDKTASYFVIPGSLGAIHFMVQDKYLLFSSVPEGLARLSGSVGATSDAGSEGDLAIRLNVSQAPNAIQNPNILSDWILATRPSSGTLRLIKQSGILEGTLNFTHAS